MNTMTIDVSRHRCLILGTDGLWNMIPPQRAVEVVQHIDRQNKMAPNSDHPMVIFNHTSIKFSLNLRLKLMNEFIYLFLKKKRPTLEQYLYFLVIYYLSQQRKREIIAESNYKPRSNICKNNQRNNVRQNCKGSKLIYIC